MAKHLKGHLLCANLNLDAMKGAQLPQIAEILYRIDTTGAGSAFEFKWKALASVASHGQCIIACLTTNAIVDDGYTYDAPTCTTERLKIGPNSVDNCH